MNEGGELLTDLLRLQEIISEEIVDETDRYEDNTSKRRAKRITTKAVMRGSVSFLLGHLALSNC